MKKPDHDMYREWLDAEAFGDLSPESLARLDRHVAECPECEEERRDFAHLATVLSRGQLPVRADFRQSVLEALPAAGWEARSPRTWSFPGAVALALGILAAVCFGAASGKPAGSPVLGAVSALAGFFRATLVAGLGLVHAGWKGWGMVFGELFASWSALAAFAVLVISLNLLLLSLVRRRPARPAGEIAARGGGPRL